MNSSFRRVRVSHHNGGAPQRYSPVACYGMDDTQIHERHRDSRRRGARALRPSRRRRPERGRARSARVAQGQPRPMLRDLLGQRRALRESGQDPDAAHARDPGDRRALRAIASGSAKMASMRDNGTLEGDACCRGARGCGSRRHPDDRPDDVRPRRRAADGDRSLCSTLPRGHGQHRHRPGIPTSIGLRPLRA